MLLSVFLIVNVICVIICLGGLMFGVLAQPFGAIEAVSLIIFVGLSVDYSLHVAESYSISEKETKYAKTQDALRRTGGAIVGAAMTSVLVCPPILMCTIRMFVQFGVIIISNMLLSLLFSVGFFSAALATIGPETRRQRTQGAP